MTNLTNYTREVIAKAATAFAFDKIQEAQKQAQDALAREAYATIFDAKELAGVAKIPANWVRRDSCLKFNVGGQSITLSLIGDGLPVPYTIGDYSGYHCKTLGSIPHGDLCDRIQRHAVEVEKTKADRSTAYRSVLNMLNGIRTIKKLATAWPEGKPFYEKYAEKPSEALPVIRTDEINQMLGIAA